MVGTLPSIVFDAWLRPRGVGRVAPVGGGLSGALVFHAVADGAGAGEGDAGGEWAVRGWPHSSSLQRVAEVHCVVGLARQAGCQVVPKIEPSNQFAFGGERSTQVVTEGRVWECCEWKPGRPPEAGDDLVGVLGEAAAGVASFHRAVAGLAAHRGPVPAVLDRLQRLAYLDPILRSMTLRPRLLSPSPHLPSDSSPRHGDSWTAVERALDCLRHVWSDQRQRAVRLLEPWARRPLRQQYVLRDIHLENALFVDRRLSGIVDYDAVRIDSPAIDLARLVGSAVLLWPSVPSATSAAMPWATLWAETLASYRAVWPLSAEEEQLARLLAEVSPPIVLANWVVWVVHEGRTFPGPATAVDRRIEGWTRMVRQQSEGEESLLGQF